MPANFPASAPALKTDYADNTDDVMAANQNQPNLEVNAIATKIGTGASTPTTGKVLTGNGTGTSAWADPAAAGASTALDNLASVAINTSLISDTDVTDDLGSTVKKWANLFVATIGATLTRVTKIWATDIESTNIPTVNGGTLASALNLSGTNSGDNAANTSIVATKLDDFTAPDDNTDLNASTSKHGLVLKATAPTAGLTNVVAIENGETVYKNKALFDATDPSTQAYGDAAAVGSAVVAARRDHKHAMPAAYSLADEAVTNAKLAHIATSTIKGRVTAATGDVEDLTAANVRTIINVADGATANAKATGAEVDTGTDDTKFTTAKALNDSHNVPSVAPSTSGNVLTSNGTDWTSAALLRLLSKAIFATRVMTTASGDVAYTGVGFVATSIIAFMGLDANTATCWGICDSALGQGNIEIYFSGGGSGGSSTLLLSLFPAAGAGQTALVKSFDADGFTLTWTKAGSPTGTGIIKLICFK